MKKKVMMAVAIAAAMPCIADTETVGDYTWTYRIVGGAAEIYKGSSTAAISPSPTGSVSVPDTLGGKTVVSVGSGAFYNCDSLTGVTIPNSVTNVGNKAFYSCSVLAYVNLPSNLKTLGRGCFESCTVLPSIAIPHGVEILPADCFAGCSSLESVSLPNSIITIEDHYSYGAFYGCSSLKSITLPSSLRKIGSKAFSDSNLKSVWIPDSVISVGQNAFYDCKDLREVRLPNGLTSIAASTFSGAGLESVVIPASVVSLASDSFNCYWYDNNYNYHYLTNVVFRGALPAGINVSKILDHAQTVYYPLAFASSYLPYVDETKFAGYTESLSFNDNPPTAQTYIVSFNANGGSGTMDNQTFCIGAAQALSANTFVRENHSFLGWSMSAGGNVVYADRQIVADLTLAAGGKVTLYAVWQSFGGGTGTDPVVPDPPALSNDNFDDAEDIAGISGNVSGSNVSATIESGESARYDSKKTVWYAWKSPVTGVAVFDTSGSVETYGSDALEDSILGVYTGNSIETLSDVAFNDDDDASIYFESKVSFNVRRGTLYRIVVGGSRKDSGRFLLNWNAVAQDVPIVPDAVVTNMITVTNYIDVAVTVTNTVTDYLTVTNFTTQTIVDTVTEHVTVTNMVEATNYVDVAVVTTNLFDVAITNAFDVIVTNVLVRYEVATNTVISYVAVTNEVMDHVTVTNMIEIAQEAAIVPEEVRDAEVEKEFAGEAAKKMSGVVFDMHGTMGGVIQVETSKASAKGVKVKGFVVMEGGKKVAFKPVTATIANGRLNVDTSVGKFGTISLTIGGDGFRGDFGAMKVVSADIGEDVGVLSGSLALKYIDAAGKVKSRKVAVRGVATGGTAAGTATSKGAPVKVFAAEFE